MNKKQIKELANIVSGLYVIFLFFLFFVAKLSNNFYLLFGLLVIGVPLIKILIVNMIPPSKKTSPVRITKSTSETNSKKQLSEKELLNVNINSLSGDDFERLCFMYFKDKGYNPKIIGRSGDHGVDLVMKDPKDGLQIAVQCKRWKDQKVGNADIIKLEGGKRFYKCPKALFITTTNYTDKAREYAEQCKVELWNSLVVEDKIGKWRAEKAKKKKLANSKLKKNG